MVFAALEYPETYEDAHLSLVAYLRTRFPKLDSGLQCDSWIWIWFGDDKVAIDTFTSMKHLVKSSRSGEHVDAVIRALIQQYTVKVYPTPELEPHEPEEYES